MDRSEIKIGTLLIDVQDNTSWRILHVSNNAALLIKYEPDSDKAVFKTVGNTFLLDNTLFKKAENQHLSVLDISSLPQKVVEIYNKKKEFVKAVCSYYEPQYNNLFDKRYDKTYFIELYTKYSFSKKLAFKIVRRYLQSGMQDSALVDPRYLESSGKRIYKYTTKTGRPSQHGTGIIRDQKALEAFEFGKKQFLGTKKMTKERAYELVIACFYYDVATYEKTGEKEVLPVGQYPTKDQFFYYLKTSVPQEIIDKKMTSDREYRNNQRLQKGRPASEAMRPMAIVEVDEVEVDLYLVAVDDGYQLVGKPKVYMMIDLFSHCIVGCGIAFEANSYLGISNVFINLLDDKRELCKEVGCDIDPAIWPTGYLPTEVRCDGGSEFVGEDFLALCRDLEIMRSREAPAMGSMKGTIEQSFRLFQQMMAPDFENKGYVRKSHDSNHREKACLNIRHFKKLVYLFIAHHNAHVCDTMYYSKDMVENHVRKTPIDVWNYGIQKYGVPRTVNEAQKADILFHLMPERNATIGHGTITFKGLSYDEFGDADLALKMTLSKRNAKLRDKDGVPLNQMKIRLDPRSVDCLYYLKDNAIMKLFLNMPKSGTYQHMTFSEYLVYRKTELDDDAENEHYALNLNIKRNEVLKGIADSVTTGTVVDKNVRTAQIAEGYQENKDNAISRRLITGQEELRDKDTACLTEDMSQTVGVTAETEDVRPIDEKGNEEEKKPDLTSPTVPEAFRKFGRK